MEKVTSPSFKITYEGKNITQDVSRHLITFRYKDKLENASDELEIVLEDSEDLWKNEWYPATGAKLDAQIGYTQMLPCGEFELDEIALDIPPDTITIRALAVPITTSLRTKKNKAHENCTLKQIAQKAASDNGLTLQGDIEEIQFERVTQQRETDLGFLQHLAKEFGYVFSIRAKTLIFTNAYKLEAGQTVISIDRSQMMRCNIKDKSAKTYRKAKLAYHNPGTNKTIQATADIEEITNPDDQTYNKIVSEDDIEINSRAENDSQAGAIARAALHGANSLQQEGAITVPGNPLLVAGNNVELTGIGGLSGKYQIQESEHEIDKSDAYKTTIQLKRVGFVSLVNHKKKAKKPRKPAQYDVEEIED